MQKNRITQSIIIGLTTLVAAVTWASLENILSRSGYWLWPIIGFFILLTFLSLNWLLAKSKAILLITLFFILISFFFPFGFRFEYLLILFIAFLFFYLASLRAIDEKKNRIKIDVVKILKRGLPFILTGLTLVIASAYYFSPLALSRQNEITIPRPLFNSVIDPVISQFERTVPFDGDFIYQQLNREINKRSKAYEEYLTLGLAIGVFFALKVVSIPFMWLVILLSWGIFKILVATGAIKIQEQTVLKEVIEV